MTILIVKILSGVVVAGLIVFLVLISDRNFLKPLSLEEVSGPPDEQTNAQVVNLPIRLIIPKISIDAEVEYVGVNILGAMDVPKGPAEVAWFEPGPRPGEEGSAVIAGHSGWKDGQPAVFDDLYKLEIGDRVYVEDDTGETIVFIVRDIRTYDPKQDAADVFGSQDGLSHLNLITCTGFWDTLLKSHSDRLIVFTDFESRSHQPR